MDCHSGGLEAFSQDLTLPQEGLRPSVRVLLYLRAIALEGLNYNNNLHVCDYPYRVECEGLPSVPVTASTDQPESSAGGETTLGPVLAPEQPAPVSEQPTLGAEQPAPIPGDAGRFYYPSSGLQKIPANVYRQGSSCKHNTLYRLNPSCSSVSLCKNGRTTVINCPGGYSYDTRYQRCLSSLTARWSVHLSSLGQRPLKP
uniref:Chitin-binding type-2 domain-containing protein n=1 Tax=Timema poppense TaxID=170557 RepID=A0A7R9H9T6_TIMPO|nr:unnamed protein product [Timema poppensis]